MSPRKSDGLLETVRWFQASVVAPHESGKRRQRLASAADYILPSKSLQPDQRVGIYVDAYLARLIEVLVEDFPAVARLLGQKAFHELCRAYLERHPSRSRSLNPLGEKMAEFLSGEVKVARRRAARDLARLEWAMSEVFDAEGTQPLSPAEFSKVAPGGLAKARLAFVPAFRLLALDHAANPYVDAVRQGRPLPPLKRRRSWIAVYRKNFQVWRLDLPKAAHAALAALSEGRPVREAVAAAASAWRGGPSLLQTQLRQWFGEWASEGFFASCRTVDI